MWKSVLALVLTLMLVLCMFVGCGKDTDPDAGDNDPGTTQTPGDSADTPTSVTNPASNPSADNANKDLPRIEAQ